MYSVYSVYSATSAYFVSWKLGKCRCEAFEFGVSAYPGRVLEPGEILAGEESIALTALGSLGFGVKALTALPRRDGVPICKLIWAFFRSRFVGVAIPLSLKVPVVSKSVSTAAIFNPRGLGVTPACCVVGAVGVTGEAVADVGVSSAAVMT